MRLFRWFGGILRVIFALVMIGPISASIVRGEELVWLFNRLGYPLYLMQILAVAYILGIIGLLQNKVPILREWAYAGYTYVLLGALSSHLIVGGLFHRIELVVLMLFILSAAYYADYCAKEKDS